MKYMIIIDGFNALNLFTFFLTRKIILMVLETKDCVMYEKEKNE